MPLGMKLEGKASQYEVLDEGTYRMKVLDIEPFRGRNFATGEEQASAKFIFEVTEGDWAGVRADKIVALANIANERSNMHKIWKALTNDTPVEGGVYDPDDLIGREALCMITHRTTSSGGVFSKVDEVLPLPGGGQRRRPQATQPAPVQPPPPARRPQHPNPTAAYMPVPPPAGGPPWQGDDDDLMDA